MGVGKIIKRIVREVIAKLVVKKKSGGKTYLLNNKESYIMATSEIDGAHGLPRDIETFNNKIQQVPHDVGQLSVGIAIKPESEKRYARRVIQRVNIK